MKRLVLLACAAAVLATACGGDPAAAPSPSPTQQHSVPAGVIPPVDKARDTVDQLNDLQNQTEQRSGSYTP